MSAASRYAAVARDVVRESRRRDVPTFAASIAYYAFVSLVPLLALVVVVASAVGGPRLEASVVGLADRYLLPTGRDIVVDAIRNTAGRRGTTVVGLLVLSWSALRLFRGLDVAFSRVYGSSAGGFLHQLRDAVLVATSIGVGIAAMVVVAAVVGVVSPRDPVLGLAAPTAVLLTLAVALFPLYYVFPDVGLTHREVLPGTLFAAVGWTVLGVGFGAYAAYASTAGSLALYGVLGGLVLLVTWFYVAALVLLVGAVVNAVLADRLTDRVGPGGRTPHTGDRQVQQAGGRNGPR